MNKWWESKWAEAIPYVLTFVLLLFTIGILKEASVQAQTRQETQVRTTTRSQDGDTRVILRIGGKDVSAGVLEVRGEDGISLWMSDSEDGHSVLYIGKTNNSFQEEERIRSLVNEELNRRLAVAPGGVSPPR